jgi:hypothetical protein
VHLHSVWRWSSNKQSIGLPEDFFDEADLDDRATRNERSIYCSCPIDEVYLRGILVPEHEFLARECQLSEPEVETFPEALVRLLERSRSSWEKWSQTLF